MGGGRATNIARVDAERRKTLDATTRWDPGAVEQRVFGDWLEGGYFHPSAEGTPAQNYSISIPPPNVTGALHMGHALNGSIQDALIRLNRMRGRNTLWILGTDHAGIATQAVVEKELVAQGTSREELGREKFTERVWEWKEQYGSTIVEQYKRLGASCDYERERFTLDEGYVRAVYRVFAELYEKGYIYRDNYMVNWDPGLGSAISDLEIENREVTDALYEIAYPLEDGGELVVATVRPETMLADTAVAVNPERRALPRRDRQERDPAAGRAAAAGDRRRARRPGVRDRRAQDHPRPRPERLRDRPRARPRGDQRDRRGRPDHRRRRRSASAG